MPKKLLSNMEQKGLPMELNNHNNTYHCTFSNSSANNSPSSISAENQSSSKTTTVEIPSRHRRHFSFTRKKKVQPMHKLNNRNYLKCQNDPYDAENYDNNDKYDYDNNHSKFHNGNRNIKSQYDDNNNDTLIQDDATNVTLSTASHTTHSDESLPVMDNLNGHQTNMTDSHMTQYSNYTDDMPSDEFIYIKDLSYNYSDPYMDHSSYPQFHHSHGVLTIPASHSLSTLNTSDHTIYSLLSSEYETLHSLGKGQYGNVNLCRNYESRALHAVKCIPKDSTKYALLQREINILSTVSHKHIIQLHDVKEDVNNMYLITEYCSGGDLFDRVMKMKDTKLGHFPESQASRILQQILSAVEHLHSHHIIHRDLKPENIVFETHHINSPIKVIDFGLSTYYNPSNSDNKLLSKVGTANYIAPEVLTQSYNEKVDIWSVGAIAYILLCSLMPFGGGDNAQILNRVRKARYTFFAPEWNSISRNGKLFVSKCMMRNVEERYSAEEALQDEWLNTNNQSDNHNKKNAKNIMTLSKLWKHWTNGMTCGECI